MKRFAAFVFLLLVPAFAFSAARPAPLPESRLTGTLHGEGQTITNIANVVTSNGVSLVGLSTSKADASALASTSNTLAQAVALKADASALTTTSNAFAQATALKQDASTAATDAELSAGLATKQDASTAATDAELAAAISGISFGITTNVVLTPDITLVFSNGFFYGFITPPEPHPYLDQYVVEFSFSGADTFTLAAGDLGVYDAEIWFTDTNDVALTTTNAVTAYNDADLIYTNGSAGTYRAHVTGDFPWPKFNNTGDKALVRNVWLGNVGVKSLAGWLYGCPDLTTITFIPGTTLENVSFLDAFRGIKDADSGITVSFSGTTISPSTMQRAFYQAQDIAALDLSSLIMTNTTSLYQTFEEATDLTNLVITGWEIPAANDFRRLLYNVPLTFSSYDGVLNVLGGNASLSSSEVFDANLCYYSSFGQTSRSILTNTWGWTINDAGFTNVAEGLLPPLAYTYTIPTETNFPSGGDFLPPIYGELPSVPMIAEYTQIAESNRTVVYSTAEELTEAFVFSASDTEKVTPVSYDSYGYMTMPQGGFNLVWPATAAATGSPVRVNGTTAWWLGPSRVDVSRQFNIYGHSLMVDGTGYAYIDGYGWLTNSSGNEYKSTFDVPDDLASGDYTVYAYNGQGGAYGWGEGMPLHVIDAIDYSSSTGMVTASSFASLESTLNAAAPNTTVFVPNGTYHVTHELNNTNIATNVFVLGESQTGVVFVVDGANWTAGDRILDISSKDGLRLKNITFSCGTTDVANRIVNIRSAQSLIEYCTFTSDGISIAVGEFAYFSGREGYDTIVENCEFIQGGQVGAIEYVQFTSNTNLGIRDFAPALIVSGFGGNNVDISSCFAGPKGTNSNEGTQGRFFVLQNNMAYNLYIGSNTVSNLKPFPDTWNKNTGENVLIENGGSFAAGKIINATSNTVSFSYLTNSPQGVAVGIYDGLGFGQVRRIVSYSGSTGTLSSAWSVIPDTNSFCVIYEPVMRTAIVGNYFDGRDDGLGTASVGVSLYGGATECYVVDNTMHETEDAVVVKSDYSSLPCTMYWNCISGNVHTNPAWSSGVGTTESYIIRHDTTTSPISMAAIFGTVVSDNQTWESETAMLIDVVNTNATVEMSVFEFNYGSSTNSFGTDTGINTLTNGNDIVVL